MTPMQERPSRLRRIDWSSVAAAAPAVAVMCVCSALPLAWMAGALLLHPEVRRELALNSFRATLLGRTLGYNGAAAVLATMMGLPAAVVLGRGRGPVARALWVLLPAALLLPSLAYGYGWKQLARMGLPALQWLGETQFHLPLLGAFHLPIQIDFRPNGPADVFRCIWSLAAWLWAVPAGLIGLSLRRMDTGVQQQALLDGALWRVTLRQLAGPIIASLAVVTVLASQEFAVYEPTGISVVATEVRMVFDTGSISSADNSIAGPMVSGQGLQSSGQAARAAAAVATAAPMLLVTIALAVLAAWGARQVSAAESLEVGRWPRILDAPRWASITTLLLLILNVAVPVASLMASLRVAPDPIKMAQEFGPQISGAIFVAVIAALVATLAAFSSAGRWTRGLLTLTGASFLIGGQLLAIALIRLFNRPGLSFWAYDTAVLTIIAYVGRFGWIAFSTGRGTWSQPWRELREMAAVDGAGTLRVAVSVVWPLAWPTLLAGGVLVGALSLTEVPATVLLMPQNPQVLTPTMMTWVHAQRSDPMIEASLVMMAVVLVPALAAIALTAIGLRLTRRGLQRPG
ncbi:MAG: iron transporter permease [Phycisphaerales bacterium]|nr:iron transporter permease [Phycisphaerales bacterium]